MEAPKFTSCHRLGKSFLLLAVAFLHSSAIAQQPLPVGGIFQNLTSRPVNVYWVDGAGQNQPYLPTPVPANGQAAFQSYPGTKWRAYDDQVFLMDYISTVENGQIFKIGGRSVPAPPASIKGTEKFYAGSWKGKDCLAKLEWEKPDGPGKVTGTLYSSREGSSFNGTKFPGYHELEVGNYDPPVAFQFLMSTVDGKVSWNVEDFFTLNEVTRSADVESFEHVAGIMINSNEDQMRAAALKWGFGKILMDQEQVSDAVGLYFQTWTYPDSGLAILMGSEAAGGWKTVYTITVKSPSNFKTGQGIGIGSTREDVINAYSAFKIDPSEPLPDPTNKYLIGSIFGGMVFSFENNRVTEIFLGPSAE